MIKKLSLALTALMAVAQLMATETIHFDIKGVDCDSCRFELKEELEKLPGVTEVTMTDKDDDAYAVDIVLKDGKTLDEKKFTKLSEKHGYKVIGENKAK